MMKYLLIAILCACYSTIALSKELYCETDEGKILKWHDPKFIPEQELPDFHGMITYYKFPYGLGKCDIEKYPELPTLSRFIRNYKHSGYKFYETPMGKFIINEFSSISDSAFDEKQFNHPMEVYKVVTLFKDKKMSKKINSSDIKMLLSEIRNEEAKKSEERKKERDEYVKKIADENLKKEKIEREKRIVQRLKGKIEDFKSYYYISKIIEKGESVINDSEEFIKLKMADNDQDFKERIIIACFEMNCEAELKRKIAKLNKNNLKFKVGDKTPLYYSVKYNNFEEFKKILDADENHEFSYEIFSLSLHLNDFKIANYYTKDREFDSRKINFDQVVLNKSLPQNSLIESLIKLTKDSSSNNYYSNYFMDKNKKYKPKHVLGYATADFFVEDEDVQQANKLLNAKIDIREIPLVGFETPSWNAKKVIIKNEKNESLIELKEHETRYEINSFLFFEIDNHWVALGNDEKRIWIHESQVQEIDFVDQVFNNTMMTEPNPEKLYEKIGGVKIPSDKSKKYLSSIQINSSKWLDGELWFNINLGPVSCGDDNEEGKIPVEGIWLKAFDGDKLNFNHYSRGC